MNQIRRVKPLLNRMRAPPVREIRQGRGMQEIQVSAADAAPAVVGRARMALLAFFSTQQAGGPGPVPVKQIDHLEQPDLRGAPLEPVSAAAAARGIDNPGVAEGPQNLGEVVGGDPCLHGKFPS